ncbi:MAG: DUF6132 family protein [Endomicrobiales bacterium]
MRIVLGIVIGGVIGFLLGRAGQCSTGACPLTSNPWTGAAFGAFIGFLLASNP